MFTVFDTALSGLSALQTAVSVVGNNLANLNTTGYKATTVQFHDLMDQQLGVGASNTDVGLGVGAPDTVRHFTQGAIQQTTGAFDAAIQGDGFFVVRNNGNQQLYTRAGNFTLDETGHLVTATGEFVQGWNAQGGSVNPSGAASDIVVPVNGVNAASPTQNMSLAVNLNSAATVGQANATYSAPVQVIDGQGATHTLTVTFTKTGANAWDFAVTIPAADLTSGGQTKVASGSLAFDGNGNMTTATVGKSPVQIKISGLLDGAPDQTINWNLVNGTTNLVTQFAQAGGVSATSQDGTAAGQITKVSLQDGGLIVAQYSSGNQQTVGQLALASIQNPESLVSVGNNNLATTPASATPAIGASGTGGRGEIKAGTLESSTVDIATEFTNLITFQRSYSANSRVITTGDQMLQDLMNVVR